MVSNRQFWHRLIALGVLVVVLLTVGFSYLWPRQFTVVPGAEVIAFVSYRNFDGHIFIMAPDGSHQTQLTSAPRWEERGSAPWWLWLFRDAVIVKSPQPAPNRYGVIFWRSVLPSSFYEVQLDGSRMTRRPLPPLVALHTDTAWSPDGQHIAASLHNVALGVMNADGSDEQCLTCGSSVPTFEQFYPAERISISPPLIRDPAWSPDGQHIVFAVVPNADTSDVFVIRRDGTQLQRLTATPGADNDQPEWSPDGKFITFRSNRTGGAGDIYVMNANGTNQIRLTTTMQEYDPTWSPTGDQLAFTSRRDGNAEIYVMNRDGSEQQRLTFETAADSEPTWFRIRETVP